MFEVTSRNRTKFTFVIIWLFYPFSLETEFVVKGDFFLLQETRKRKGLKEGLPDLTQYLDKL
jgi:hypothetical protein